MNENMQFTGLWIACRLLLIPEKAYIMDTMSMNIFTNKPNRKKRIAARVRNIHMLILVLVLILVAVMAIVMVTGITDGVSENMANFYSSEAMGKFNLYVNRELILAR